MIEVLLGHRGEDDGLVAGIENRADREMKRVDSRRGDDDLAVGIELDVVQPAVVVGDLAP
jgi:hypothetical protein